MKSSYVSELALPPSVEIEVDLVDDNEVNQEEVDNYVDGLERPSWYKHDNSNQYDTRLYMLEVYQPFSTTEIDGVTERVWKCESCNGPILYSGIHLGHKRGWKDELKHAGVTNAAEAKAAYNNLGNLRIECATCNQSHDFE